MAALSVPAAAAAVGGQRVASTLPLQQSETVQPFVASCQLCPSPRTLNVEPRSPGSRLRMRRWGTVPPRVSSRLPCAGLLPQCFPPVAPPHPLRKLLCGGLEADTRQLGLALSLKCPLVSLARLASGQPSLRCGLPRRCPGAALSYTPAGAPCWRLMPASATRSAQHCPPELPMPRALLTRAQYCIPLCMHFGKLGRIARQRFALPDIAPLAGSSCHGAVADFPGRDISEPSLPTALALPSDLLSPRFDVRIPNLPLGRSGEPGPAAMSALLEHMLPNPNLPYSFRQLACEYFALM